MFLIFKSSAGELDDQLNPVGKEVFTMEEEQEEEDAADGEEGEDYSGEGRPGTTKRKQYYFKRVSGSMWFTNRYISCMLKLFTLSSLCLLKCKIRQLFSI